VGDGSGSDFRVSAGHIAGGLFNFHMELALIFSSSHGIGEDFSSRHSLQNVAIGSQMGKLTYISERDGITRSF
jgi:hypothetical protein